MAAVSTVVNHSILLPYVFSNYTHPHGSISKFPQSCKHRLWEALRASTAAPGFFEEFKLGHDIHQVFYENIAWVALFSAISTFVCHNLIVFWVLLCFLRKQTLVSQLEPRPCKLAEFVGKTRAPLAGASMVNRMGEVTSGIMYEAL